MPAFPCTFDTDGPIRVTLRVPYGDVTLETSDAPTASVVLTTRNSSAFTPHDDTVTFRDGHLRIEVERPQGILAKLTGGEGPDVRVTLPHDSRVDAECTFGDLRLDGRYASTDLRGSSGDVDAGTLTGECDVTLSNGDIRIDTVDGRATLKTSNGDIKVRRIAGEVRATTANGDIHVDWLAGELGATTSAGDIKVDAARLGSIAASTRFGDLRFGVVPGTAVWADAHAGTGDVRSELEASEGPDEHGPRLEVRAQTSFGDIVLKRAKDDRR